MGNNEPKEGVSVKEIEKFAKKYRYEVFFALTFILASFFSFVVWGTGWSTCMTGLGGLIGVVFPATIDTMANKACAFVFKQEQIVQVIMGIVVLILSIFIPPLIFLWLGIHGGRDLFLLAMRFSSKDK